MEPEEKRNLERVLRLSEENHRMIRKLYRSYRWGRFWTLAYWVVIVGVAFGVAYYLQPYLDKIARVYSGLQGQIDTVQQVGNTVTNSLGNLGR